MKREQIFLFHIEKIDKIRQTGKKYSTKFDKANKYMKEGL